MSSHQHFLQKVLVLLRHPEAPAHTIGAQAKNGHPCQLSPSGLSATLPDAQTVPRQCRHVVALGVSIGGPVGRRTRGLDGIGVNFASGAEVSL